MISRHKYSIGDTTLENLAEEIFNILKGANYQLRLFTSEGKKTLDANEATRFYAFDQDLMVTIRVEDAKGEVVVQAGQDYDVIGNKKLLNSLKSVAHKNLSEYTVRKFDKKIAPKDFAHQSVVQEGFSKPFGSIKTSYVKMSEARLIIKHSKGVNEEVRGARSRHIHSLFIENSQGEKFKFPHRYMAGAKAMAMHVNEGGTPYDDKGKAILSMCEEIADLNMFVRHVKTNNLVNETNGDIVEAVRSRLNAYKNTIKTLSTQKGYNNFQVQENNEESSEKAVDISEKFLYNTFTTEQLNTVLDKVGRIVAENDRTETQHKEALMRVINIIKSGEDLKLGAIDTNDPDHPDNRTWNMRGDGAIGKLNATLDFIGLRSKNEDLWNALMDLSGGDLLFKMSPQNLKVAQKIADYLTKAAGVAKESTPAVGLDETVIKELRQQIS